MCRAFLLARVAPCTPAPSGALLALDADVCYDAFGIPGIQSSNGVACCLASCGACGGSGCSLLEGGGDGCCTDNIIEINELCESKGEAPCLIIPQRDDPIVSDDDTHSSSGGESWHHEGCEIVRERGEGLAS